MVIKKEETYVLKLTEYREISNVLKTGDEKLVSQLMKDLKDIAIRCKKVSKLPGVKTFVDYINSKDNFFSYVSVFYNYEEKVFRAKVRHDNFKDTWYSEEFSELKDMFSQVGVEVIVTGKPTVEKILKILTNKSLNKNEKENKILDLIEKSVKRTLAFESRKVTQTAADDRQRFKRVLFGGNVNIDYILKDKFFREVLKETIDKIVKRDIKNPSQNLIFENDIFDPYKIGEMSHILRNKTAAKYALESMDLVKRKDKTINVGYLYTKNLLDFIGGLMISSSITSLTDEEKFSILSEKIPESCSVRIGGDYSFALTQVSNIGSFVNGDFKFDKLEGFFDESVKFVNYLKVINKKRARVVLNLVFNILKINKVMEEELAFNLPKVFTELFKLRHELFGEKKDFTVNPDFYYRINITNYDSKFSKKLSELKTEFDKAGLNLFFVLDENIKSVWGVDKTSDFNKFIVNLAKETNSKILVDLLRPNNLSFDILSLFYESTRALSKVMTRNRDYKLCLYLDGIGRDIRTLDENSVRLFTSNKVATKSVINTLEAFTSVVIYESKEEDTKMFSSQGLINNLSILTEHFYEPVNKFDPLN